MCLTCDVETGDKANNDAPVALLLYSVNQSCRVRYEELGGSGSTFLRKRSFPPAHTMSELRLSNIMFDTVLLMVERPASGIDFVIRFRGFNFV